MADSSAQLDDKWQRIMAMVERLADTALGPAQKKRTSLLTGVVDTPPTEDPGARQPRPYTS